MPAVCPNCQASYPTPPRFCLQCGQAMPVAGSPAGSLPAASLQLGPTQPGGVRALDRAAMDRLADTRDSQDEGQGPDESDALTLVGKVVDDRYRVLEVIGRGGMGAVYKVEHVEMGKVMAMKVLHRDLARERNVVRRFKREAQAISRLTHVNTVSIFDFGRDSDGFMYLVMEYLRGEDLGIILKRDGAIGFHRAGPMLVQVCSALVEAHEVGIIHRDLKPENILVARTREGQDFVKVLDFGLAKLREESQGADVTGHGHVVGTPYFMSPEQIRAEPLDHRSDIYSLGALAYRMLTGENPFLASSALGVLTKHLMDQLVLPRERRPDLGIPEPAERIIVRAMEKRPQDRYQSADEMRKAIEAGLAELSTPPRIASVPVDGLPPPLVTYVGERAGRRVTDLASAGPTTSGAKEPTTNAGATAYPVSTREDWDRYERRLRRRRWFQVVGLPLLLGALAGGGWYALRDGGRLFERVFDTGRESEPNNTPEQANPLQSGATVRGQLGARLSPTESDNDWFKIVLPPGAPPHSLELSVDGIPNMDLRVELFDDHQRLYTADATGVGGREVIPNYRLNGRVFYLRIHEAPVAGKPPTENPTDDYMLKVLFRPAVATEELEPNDHPAQAMVVRAGQRISGYLGAPSDVDWFRLEAPASRSVQIAVTAIPQVNLRLLVAEGDVPAAALPAPRPATAADPAETAPPAVQEWPPHRVIDKAGPGEGERTVVTVPAGGEVLFAVQRIDPPAGRQRPAEVPGLTVPYTLSVDLEN
jgi:serine/threonine-protein kinase